MNTFFLSEANKLKNIQVFLEKNDYLINLLSKCGDEFDLCDNLINSEKNRKEDINKLNNELKEIWKSLDFQKSILGQDIHSLDLRSFKKDMIIVQEKIHNLKLKLKINSQMLKDQEKDIWEIVEAYNQKMVEWDKPLKYFSSINYKINSISKVSTHNSDNKEVKEFLDFVSKSNGHENGWSSDDHHLFLKIRNKYKDIENLALNMNKILPDISPDEVKKHEAWFQKYLLLKSKKDEALERWRRAKSENTDQKDNEINDNNRNAVKNMLFKPTDRSVHEKIALWRAEKEAKRQQEQIYEQMQKERLNRVEDERRRLHEQLKKSVAKWKEEKLTKEQSEKLQKEIMEYQERKIRAAEANHMIKRFQSQDDIFIVKMKHSKLKEKNEVKRSKSSYIANRDPERILKPTKQWLLRTSKDNFMDSQVPVFVSNVRTIPKLRMPEWRRNT